MSRLKHSAKRSGAMTEPLIASLPTIDHVVLEDDGAGREQIAGAVGHGRRPARRVE